MFPSHLGFLFFFLSLSLTLSFKSAITLKNNKTTVKNNEGLLRWWSSSWIFLTSPKTKLEFKLNLEIVTLNYQLKTS